MTTRRKPSSPLLGWMSAGADLVAEQVEQVTGMVSKQLDATHALFEELQQRGEPVDEQLRQTLSPTSVFSSLQTLVMANPLFSLFAGNKKAATREQQLEVLSAKVDLLVEQVALLAAKKAQQQAAAQTTSEKAKPAPKRTARSKAATAKSTPKTATKSTAKTAAEPAKAADKPATRKRSSASTKRSTGTSSRKTSGTTKKAE